MKRWTSLLILLALLVLTGCTGDAGVASLAACEITYHTDGSFTAHCPPGVLNITVEAASSVTPWPTATSTPTPTPSPTPIRTAQPSAEPTATATVTPWLEATPTRIVRPGSQLGTYTTLETVRIRIAPEVAAHTDTGDVVLKGRSGPYYEVHQAGDDEWLCIAVGEYVGFDSEEGIIDEMACEEWIAARYQGAALVVYEETQ